MRSKALQWGTGLVCALAFGARPALAATIAVPAGGNLQAALNAAQAGDVITLAPGAVYAGNFTLPNKGPLADYITIRSAAPDSLLPPAGVRMTPDYSSQLPRIKSSNTMSALRTAAAANHYRFMFVEFQANVSGYGDIIDLGWGDATQTQLSQVPYALVLDRVYVHGDPVLGQKRCVALNSADTTIVNSYIADCKAVGQDAQAIGGWNGPGNYLIENNYLEGATENVLIGGADPAIPGLVTTNITVRRNYLSKPLAWRDPIIATPVAVTATAAPASGTLAPGTYYYKVAARVPAGQGTKANSTASAEVSAVLSAAGGVRLAWTPVVGAADYVIYGRTAGGENMYWTTANAYFTDSGAAGAAGTPAKATRWAVKNIFELKNAQDVVVEGNVFENLWIADQQGFPIVFTPRNQGGTAPWTVVQRVTFRYNIVRHTAGGVTVLGTDNNAPSQLTNHLTIQHNVFDDLTGATWGTGARPFQIGDGGDSITIDHNTVVTTDTSILWLYGGSATSPTVVTKAVFTNNMAAHNAYGIMGSSIQYGNPSIAAYLPGGVVAGNVLAGGTASKYPAGNFFPSVAAWQAGFVNYAAGEYRLADTSPYKGIGTDGTDLGANAARVTAETANALSGDNRIAPGTAQVRILTTSLPNGVYKQPYAQLVTCGGIAGACAWRVVDSSLPAGVTFDAIAGAVVGTPTEVATGLLTLAAYDPAWPTNAATAALALTIDPPPFIETISPVGSAQVGAPFAASVSVTGALGEPSYSVVSGELPQGVALDARTGAISGTPLAWGTTTALVQALDSWRPDRVDAKPLTVAVAPEHLAVATSALASAQYNAMYSAALTATGGTGATTWSIVGGALPPGVTVDADGSVSGVPTALGTFDVMVQATDTNWPTNTATGAIALDVVPPPFTVSLPPAAAGSVGVPFQIAGSTAGQVGVVSWTVSAGSLPAGLALDTVTGVIAGVPVASGRYTALIAAVDAYATSARIASAAVDLVVAPASLVVSPATLAAGNVRQQYRAALTAAGGTGATAWSFASGALPPGLTLGADGTIGGVPTAVGTYAFAVQAADLGWPGNVATGAFTIAVGAREIVLYASDAAPIVGAWSLVGDLTAAGGVRIANPDAGGAKVNAPLANPANYFEIAFQAEAGIPYHLWVRGKAEKNSWANDSVMVQFSGSTDAAGAAKYRIGTTSGQDVNIEDCSGCGVSGWGWQDNGWGVNVLGANIYFAATGTQTIRVQVKEDGLSIDQLVLSSSRYLTVSPGALKNDATILSR